MKPIYYEQAEDPRIPTSYGIESSDGSFYAYQWDGSGDDAFPCYADQPYPTYEAALRAIRQSRIIEGLIELYNRTYQYYLQVATQLAGVYRIGHHDPAITAGEHWKQTIEDRLDGILFRLSLVGCSQEDFTAYEEERRYGRV